MSNHDERQLLVHDARLLIGQYEARNAPFHALTADQRKAWAAEMVVVMQDLADALAAMLPEGSANQFSIRGQWNLAMREGRRPVTYKVPPGPPYGGIRFRDPPFKDDPTDPRGKPPRYSR